MNYRHTIQSLTTPLLAVATAIVLLCIASCSTTKRIPEGEQLYTGVKKTSIVTGIDTVRRVPASVVSALKEAVNVAPNNCLISPSIRYPFPIGLWVYNNWNNPPKGFKHWLYEKLVQEPVLISDVRPGVRTHMMEQIMDNNGFFRGTASYRLVQGKNPKKASVIYDVVTGPAYNITQVRLLPDSTALTRTIDSLAHTDPYLGSVDRYCTDSLSAARVRIANKLRNQGYYFFRPEYIEYLADSLITPGSIVLQLDMAENIPPFALDKYRVGDITVVVNRHKGGGRPDTLMLDRDIRLIQMMPSRLRHRMISENVTLRTGRTLSVREMNRTQTYLSRLGVFNAISIDPVVDSTTIASRTLPMVIRTTFDSPVEVSFEVNASSKSNSYIGPGLAVGFTNRNIFGGGEQFSLALNGSYEWQTGSGHRGIFNSYEVGLTASLAIPRLLAPRFIPQRHRTLNWTRFQLNADLLNRPHFFKMAQFNASINYDWQATRHVTSTFTPFKLTYTKLMHTTAEFDSIMSANPAVAQSFKSQFIPQMAYQYMYDRKIGRNNTLNWQFSIQEAGNLFWCIYQACGKKGEKNLFGTPFSQFVKGTTQLVWGHRLAGEHWLVSRVAVGAAHAYGNSSQVPYSEQFYCGGANSVRAFTVRSIGPGSYRAPNTAPGDYFDQTGTFKFEANIEYRFPIIGILHGAVFLDSGNVWLLKDDPQRPGGTLKASSFLKDLATGTGVGLRVDIGMLVLRGDLGIGIHAPYKTDKNGYYNMPSFGKSLAFHLAIGYPF